jgi:hypothetical protein
MEAFESAEPPVRYILGARMRRQKEVSEEVLRSHGAWTEVTPERTCAKDPSPLKVREVKVHGHRYVLCLNEEERRKDAADRVAIVASLQKHLKQGPKSLVGNKGYRRYLAMQGEGRFVIDEKRLQDDARFDGLWVLRTNTDYETDTVATTYKMLWTVEALIRTTKTILETRPIWHKRDATIRGHVFCSFLALRLKVELERRLATTSTPWEWAEVLRGLDDLHEVEAVFQGKHFLFRSQLTGQAHLAIRAAGVAVPATVREL